MKHILLYIILASSLSSCMHNKLRYIQDKNEIFDKVNEYSNQPPDYKIQVKDILYIKISSTNKELDKYFNIGSDNLSISGDQRSGSAFFLRGFTVNDSGFVEVPVLGDILVEGLTIKEIQTKIQKITDEHLNNAIATTRLVSFYITFLGEINGQGKQTIMQDNINILDAVALAGGISDYGNRKNVLIVRQTKTGTKTFRVDLTKRSLLSSDKFYLLPNDIVIVEPLMRKSFQLSARDYTLVLSTITSSTAMIFLILNFLK